MRLKVNFAEIEQRIEVKFGRDEQRIMAEFGEVLPIGDASQLPVYSGEFVVTPAVDAQTIPTAQKFVENDITVKAIPYFNVSNTAGGSTVYIGNEV